MDVKCSVMELSVKRILVNINRIWPKRKEKENKIKLYSQTYGFRLLVLAPKGKWITVHFIKNKNVKTKYKHTSDYPLWFKLSNRIK